MSEPTRRQRLARRDRLQTAANWLLVAIWVLTLLEMLCDWSVRPIWPPLSDYGPQTPGAHLCVVLSGPVIVAFVAVWLAVCVRWVRRRG